MTRSDSEINEAMEKKFNFKMLILIITYNKIIIYLITKSLLLVLLRNYYDFYYRK